MVHGRFSEFFAAFGELSRYVIPPLIDRFKVVFETLTLGWQWLLLLPTYILWLVCTWHALTTQRGRTYALFASSVVAVVAALAVYPVRTFPFVFAIAWTNILVWIDLGKRRALAVGAVAVIFLLSQTLAMLSFLFEEHDVRVNHDAVRTEVRAIDPAAPLWIDSVAARYVYDYRLPPNSLSWEFVHPLPTTFPQSLAERPSGTVWVIQKNNVLLGTVQPLTVAGRRFLSLAKNPYEVTVVQ